MDDANIDDDMPEVGMDAVLGDTASSYDTFGPEVKYSEYEDLSEGKDDPDHWTKQTDHLPPW